MRIAVVADTKVEENNSFIRPLLMLDEVIAIDVFGDRELNPHPKIRYITPFFKRPVLLKNIFKVLQVAFRRQPYDMIWGIYEIPHGLIAFLGGLFRRSKIVVSIIGNPGYSTIRKGLWKRTMLTLIRRIDIVTVTGSRSKEFLMQSGIPGGKILILPNSIDTDSIVKGNEEKIYDVVSLGRLSHEKELPVFVEIVDVLCRRQNNIKAAIAGKGPEYENIIQQIQACHLEHNIAVKGFVADKFTFYRSAKILVITSSTEGLPRTIVEAMACGLVCVAPDVGDIRDLIVDGKTGFLIGTYDDVSSYVQKIEAILRSTEQYYAISKNSVEHIRSHFSFASSSNFWRQAISQLYPQHKSGD